MGETSNQPSKRDSGSRTSGFEITASFLTIRSNATSHKESLMLPVMVDIMTTIYCHIENTVSVSRFFASNYYTFSKVWYDYLLVLSNYWK